MFMFMVLVVMSIVAVIVVLLMMRRRGRGLVMGGRGGCRVVGQTEDQLLLADLEEPALLLLRC